MEGSIESNDDWLISPPLEMDGIYRLKFLYKTGFTGGEFEVRMSVDSDDLIDFTEELVETQYVSDTNGEYLEKIVIIPNVTGTVRIGWHVTSEIELESDISIDEVSVELVENCVEPLNLAVGEVDINSAVITWSNMFEAENWRYVLREQNEEVTDEPEEDGILTDSNTNTLVETIDGDPLQPATTYEFFVKTVCDDNSYSIWSGSFVFTTSCSSFPLPYTDGFENIANFGCWTITDANSDGQSFVLTNFESFEGGASIYYSGFGDQGHDDWLISP